MNSTRRFAVPLLAVMAASTVTVYGYDDSNQGFNIKRVLVLSIDGMHALDLARWVKNNPNSALAQLSSQGVNFTNASSTKPSDSIPATVAIFTGASPALGGMYY